MTRFTRTLALFVLCSVLVAPLATAAAPLRAGHPMQAQLTVGTGEFLGWLHGVLTSFWLKAGCRADPNGICLLPPPPPASGTNDAGSGLDPDGRGHS
jgi:hypothetical protein